MKISKLHFNRPKLIKALIALLAVLFILRISVHEPLFDAPYSRVLYDRYGHLLAASIAADEQWRFPEQDSVPYKFRESILMFEDEYFFYHPGINPVSIGRAMIQNIRAGRIKSGGSTISMQLVRLSQERRGKSWWRKITESFVSLGVELRYSKSSILKLYTSHAPFGGNVVGLDAAAWRYFGKSSTELSWAESATLAVLPNAPALIFPGKNSQRLLRKRDALLRKLHQKGKLDALELKLALEETLPDKPHPLPQNAMYLLNRSKNDWLNSNRISSTLQKSLQLEVEHLLRRTADFRKANGIHHAAILVLNVKTGQVEAYAGNAEYSDDDRGSMVDMIPAPRSTGSILKPILLGAALQEGRILPYSLIPDIPTQIGGYVPKNFNLTYDGAVPARNAISRSLNIPSVRMLNQLGVGKFHNLLRQAGMSTITRSPMHYGLSLILGGAEGRLDEICLIYANLARSLLAFNTSDPSYDAWLGQLQYINDEDKEPKRDSVKKQLFTPAVIYEVFQAMVQVSRPDEEASWSEFSSGRRVAWKTGTSFGHRDAWSVGVTPNYVVGVWVGNANGASSASLTGIGAAAPLMFDVFQQLPVVPWFSKPEENYQTIKVCKKSGYVAGLHCGRDAINKDVPEVERNRITCPYHQSIFLDKQTGERVNASCADPSEMEVKSWFILPPAIEFYYKQKHADYVPLPFLRAGCNSLEDIKNMEVIYPRDLSEIFIPRNWKSEKGAVVFEATHRDPQVKIYWNLDGKYVGQTAQIHRISMQPHPGEHVLSLIDAYGNKISRKIMIYTKD
ncbi:MAG: penicillin-binding protein 1C [Flavobacteriales bacterium]